MKKQELWTDAQLREAAGQVRQSLLDSAPPPSQCQHEFSESFKTSIQELSEIHKGKKHPHMFAKVASIILTILFMTGIGLAMNTEARAVVVNWFVKQYESSMVFGFSDHKNIEEPSSLLPTWIPDGYYKSSEEDYWGVNVVTYKNDNNNILFFSWFTIDGAISAVKATAGGDPIYVGSSEGVFIAGESGQNELTWTDSVHNLCMTLSGALSQKELLKMAESVR